MLARNVGSILLLLASRPMSATGLLGYVSLCCDVPSKIGVLNTNTGVAKNAFLAGRMADSIALSPDGTRAYVANAANPSLSVIDTVKGKNLLTIPLPAGNAAAPFQVAASPDGKRVYVAADHSVPVSHIFAIDTKTGRIAATIPIPAGAGYLTGIVVSPDSKYVYGPVSATDSYLLVVDTTTGTVAGQIPFGEFPEGQLVITPDGQTVVVPDANNELAVIDVVTLAVTRIPLPGSPTSQPAAIAISPNGQRVYVSYSGPSLLAVELSTGLVDFQTPVHPTPVYLAATPDGAFLLSANSDSSIFLMDVTTGTVTKTFNQAGQVTILAISPDGQSTYVVNSSNGSLSTLDLILGQVSSNHLLGQGTYAVAVTPDNSQTWVGNTASNTLSVFGNAKDRVLQELPGLGARSIAFVPSGAVGYLVLSSSVAAVSTADYHRLATVHYAGLQVPMQAVVSPDGTRCYVSVSNVSGSMPSRDEANAAFSAGYISVVDTRSNTKIASIPLNAVGAIALSPNGSMLYVSGNQGHVYAVDTSALRLKATISLQPSNGILTDVQEAPDSSRVYVLDRRNAVIDVVDPISNLQTGSFAAGNHPVSLAFTPNSAFAYAADGPSLNEINARANVMTGTIALPYAGAQVAISH